MQQIPEVSSANEEASKPGSRVDSGADFTRKQAESQEDIDLNKLKDQILADLHKNETPGQVPLKGRPFDPTANDLEHLISPRDNSFLSIPRTNAVFGE